MLCVILHDAAQIIDDRTRNLLIYAAEEDPQKSTVSCFFSVAFFDFSDTGIPIFIRILKRFLQLWFFRFPFFVTVPVLVFLSSFEESSILFV